MAQTQATDLQIYNPEFQLGLWEGITQVIDFLNSKSGGTINMSTVSRPGHYVKEAFFKQTNLVNRRDITSSAAVTPIKLEQDENIAVKLNRRIGPADFQRSALRKIASTSEEASVIAGRMAGQQKAQEMLNIALTSMKSALVGHSSNASDIGAANAAAANVLLTTSRLVDLLALYGDNAQNVAAFAMHSKAYFDLVKEQISANVFNVGGVVVATASPVTLNRPVIMTDSSALITAATTGSVSSASTDDNAAEYHTLGLLPGAIDIEETEVDDIVTEIVTGGENLVYRIQGEYAYNIGLKGFKWDTANGGVNPNDAALAVATNWDQTAASGKSLGAGLLTHN